MPATLSFLSRVTREFESFDEQFRQALAPTPGADLKTPADIRDYDSGLTTLDKLWEHIESADAVVHLVGEEPGAVPAAATVQEFLARLPELRAWLAQHRIAAGHWTYTQWEAYLARFQQHRSGHRPLLFLCRKTSPPRDALSTVDGPPANAAVEAHLATLRQLGRHVDLHFRNCDDLLTKLLTSAFGRLLHAGAQDRLLPLPALGTTLRNSIAARALLAWPQLTTAAGKGRWLRRPELKALVKRILRQPHSLTLLLGDPGCGKSALLARVAQVLPGDRFTVIPVKVDRVDETIVDLPGLARDLGLPEGVDLITSIRRLAVDGPVVVLLDQLDALASLLVQSPKRLRVFIRLIHDLAEIPQVHVIASCRSFEQRHDPLLKSIEAMTQSLTLHPPEWPAVESVLARRGIATGGWNAELRDTLRSPQALAIFLELLGDADYTDVLRSYQGMLDRLWESRVVAQQLQQLAETVASEMAGREQLWIPEVRFDAQLEAVHRLVAAGILVRDAGRIGFRHQTLFEYARVRSFARTPGTLVAAVRTGQRNFRLRPQVWHALHYLRATDLGGYHQVLVEMWHWTDLRAHLRMLLIELMGQQQAPSDQEARLLSAQLDQLEWRVRVLAAATGSQGWFQRWRHEKLPALMRGDFDRQQDVLYLLTVAMPSDQGGVLDLIDRHWMPEPGANDLIWRSLERVHRWDSGIVRRHCTILARDNYHAHAVTHRLAVISNVLPDEAPQLLTTWLDRQLQLDEADIVAQQAASGNPTEATSAREFKRCCDALQKADFHDALAAAEAAPAAFVAAIWPWLLRVLEATALEGNIYLLGFRQTRLSWLSMLEDEEEHPEQHLLRAVDLALCRWAEQDDAAFLQFLERHQKQDDLIVQSLLARALRRIVERQHCVALNFLCADPRRLALGPRSRRHVDSWKLIAEMAPRLDRAQLDRLEAALLAWTPYRDVAGEDESEKAMRTIWRREHQLLLLRALPPVHRSPQLAALIAELEVELPDVQPEDPIRTLGGWIGSPISVEQMSTMTDVELLAAIEKLPDSTGDAHPRDFMRGGAVQLGQELAKLAETAPERAMGLARELAPTAYSVTVGGLLAGLASSTLEPPRVFAFVEEMLARGFEGRSLEVDVAHVVERLVSATQPLPESLFETMKGWLAPSPPAKPRPRYRTEDQSDSALSVLWRHRTGHGAGGNFMVLHALSKACLVANPPMADRWLDMLEAHVEREEDPDIWAAMVVPLQDLHVADRDRSTHFVNRLLARQPELLPRWELARLLASCLRWADEDRALAWLQELLTHGNPTAVQAAGELLMLRHLWRPQDATTHQRVARLLDPENQAQPETRHARIGMAHTVARFWAVDGHRPLAHRYWCQLVQDKDAAVLTALAAVFRPRQDADLATDDYTRELLAAAFAYPTILRQPPAEFLVEQLLQLLKRDWEAELVGWVALAIVEGIGAELADARTSWSRSDDPLTDIAVLLQDKDADCRDLGLELMEKLLELNLAAIQQMLTELDKRMSNRALPIVPRRRPRLRRTTAHGAAR